MTTNILKSSHGGDVIPYYLQHYILKVAGTHYGSRLSDTMVHSTINQLYGKKYVHDSIIKSHYYSHTIRSRITFILWDALIDANNVSFIKLFVATYIFSMQFAYLYSDTRVPIRNKIRVFIESIRNVDAYNTWAICPNTCEGHVTNHHCVSPGAIETIRRAKKSKYAYMYELETILYKKAHAIGDTMHPSYRDYLYNNDKFTHIPIHTIFSRLHLLKKLNAYTIPKYATISTIANDICRGDEVLRLEELRTWMATMKGYPMSFLTRQYPDFVKECINCKLITSDDKRL